MTKKLNHLRILLARINKKRKQLLQVSLTPNNPDGLRSHLFINIKFQKIKDN